MTEEQIERRAEAMMDALDRLLMKGAITQADYDAECRDLDNWCNGQRMFETHLPALALGDLYRLACHGAGAEPRWQARDEIRRRADALHKRPENMLMDAGHDIDAYFATRPTCRTR